MRAERPRDLLRELSQQRGRAVVEQRLLPEMRVRSRTITALQILQGTITTDEIAALTITAGNISANAITTEKLNAEAVTAAKIKAETIEAAQIKAGTITAGKISAGAITAEKLAAESVEAGKIKAGAVTATKIAAEAVEAAAIKAGAITTAKLAAESVEAGKIKAGTITATQIAAETITSAQIASATITGSNIAGSTITASKISVTNLSSLSADLGTITAGTVTGATLRTAATGKRVVQDAEGLRLYNGAEAVVLNASTVTGNLTLKGKVEEGSEVPAPTVTGQLTDAQIKEIAAAKVTGVATRTNYAANPYAAATAGWWEETNSGGGWTGTVIERKTDWGMKADGTIGAGGSSIRVASTRTLATVGSVGIKGPAKTILCAPGQRATCSCYVKTVDASASTPASRGWRPLLQFQDASGAVIESIEGEVADEGSEGLRLVITGVAPALTVYVNVFFRVISNTEGDFLDHRYTGMLIEVGSEVPAEAGSVFPTPPQIVAKLAQPTGTENTTPWIYRTLGLPVATELVGKLTDAQLEAIAAAKITGTIVESQIGTGAVTAAKIASEAVEAGKLKSEAVEAAKIKTGAVTEAKIAALAVTAGKISAEAIEAGKIKAGAVGAVAIAAEAVEAAKIKAGAIETGKLAAGAVVAEKIGALAVTAEKLAAESVEAGKVKAGAITAGKLAAEAVESAAVKADAITSAKIAAGTIVSGDIAAGEIKAINIGAEAIEAGHLKADSVTSAKIAAETIVAGDIAAGTITGSKLAAETVTATQIAASTITAAKLSVTTLSAITANLGEVTAGTIKGNDIILKSDTAEEGAALSSLEWRNASNTLEANLFTFSSTTPVSQVVTKIEANKGGLKGQGRITLQAIAEGNTKWAEISLTGAAAKQSISLQAGAISAVTLLNSSAESDFLQLASTAKRKINFGTVKLKWTASALSATAEVTHGVGAEPSAVFLCSLTAPEAGKVPVANVTAKTSTKFSVNAETKNSHSGEISLMWVAIG